MKSIRHLVAARRVLAASMAACGLAVGLAAGAPAAHAGTGCTWAPITLVNGWHSEQGAYGTGDPSVCLEDDGMVYLSGSVAAPSGSLSSEFGTLPVWDWPTRELYFDVYTLNDSYGVLRIDPDGAMWAYGGLGRANGYTSLAGVSYPDAAVTQTDLPLENGWQSADGAYNTGDPAYSITNGVVHLSGSLTRPAGTPAPYSPDWAAAVLPWSAASSGACSFVQDTYTFDGGISELWINGDGTTLNGANAQYTSLAGINYPANPVTWQPLSMLNPDIYTISCIPGGDDTASYIVSGNVVYLSGTMEIFGAFSGEVGVLPPAARPTHTLWMIAEDEGWDSVTYADLRINPDGSVWVSTPAIGGAEYIHLSALSFHLGS